MLGPIFGVRLWRLIEAERANLDIYDDFKLKKTLVSMIVKNISALWGLTLIRCNHHISAYQNVINFLGILWHVRRVNKVTI